MEVQPHDYQTIINVLLTLLGFAAGIGVAHFGILRQLNKIKTDVAVQEIKLKQAQSAADLALTLHQETLTLQTKMVEQNNLLINQIIAHSQIQKEPH